MALNLNEEATLGLKVETGQFNAELKALDDRSKELLKTLKEIEKTNPDGKKAEAWKAVKTELDNTRKAQEALNKTVDISTMSYGQLQNHVKQLERDLRTLKPGTEEFIAATAKLTTARTYLDQVTQSTKNVGAAAKQTARDLTGVADSSLTFGELRTKVEQLKAKLDTLSPASKEFITTARQLNTTQKAYDDVKKSVDDATQALHKQILEAKNSDLTYGQLETKVKLLNAELKKLKPGTEDFIKATKNLADAEKAFDKVNKEVDSVRKQGEELGKPTIWQKISGGVGSVAVAFQAFMALQVIGFIVDIGKAIFETTAKFEKYEKILGTALGSEKLAKESMAALKKLGQDTAFTVEELTEGYVKMVNRGLRPSQKEMVALTDLAASQGKSFDQLVEAALDAQTGEFERLKEFGIRASKAGDTMSFAFKDASLQVKQFGKDFQVVDKENGKVIQTFKTQEEAIQGVMVKFGTLKGVGGQNAEIMKTLSGQVSNAGDSLDNLMVTIGDKLMPVFTGLLSGFSTGVQWLQKVWAATDPVIAVFGDLFDAVGALAGSLLPIIQRIFPGLNSQSVTISGVMQVVAGAFRIVVNAVQVAVTALIAIGQTMGGVMQAGRALDKVLRGDLTGAATEFDKAKETFNRVGTTAKHNFMAIANGWKEAMVEAPKKAAPEAVFAAADTEKKRQAGMSDEQKKAQEKREKEAEKNRKKEEKEHEKHLAEFNKANEKALIELSKIESDAYIASIKDEQLRDQVKLQVKRDQRAEEIMRTVADKKLQDAQIKALDQQLELDLTNLKAEQAEKRKKKDEEVAAKRLEVEKTILTQQQAAENAVFDWRELMAKNNAGKLADIHRERTQRQLQLTLEKLQAEETAELAKAARDATTTQQAEAAKQAIEDRYRQERQLATAKNAAEIEKIERELKEKKVAIWTEAGNAFSSLLKGDLSAFVGHLDKMVQGEKEAWQKRLGENMGKYQAVAQMATAAVDFLNQLEQQKAEKAINEARRERDEKVRILQEQLATEKTAQEAAEAEKQRITQQSDETIRAIKSSSQQAISSLEQQYRELSSSQEKAKLQQQLDSYKQSADERKSTAQDTAQDAIESAKLEAKESIAAAQLAEKESIRSAQNEKDQKIDAAEAARDAEIAAINKRKDIDQATRQQLLSEAKAKFEQEKQMAQQEAQEKIDQAKKTASNQKEQAEATAKLKAELAKSTQEAELKAIEAVQKGDEKAAKEILAKAKEDQKEKIRLAKEEADKKIEEAEKEKREKLKKVEAEKQARLQNQKELNRSIEAENKKAADTERAAKEKAWKAQQKADIASALIAGALATVKALASGFFPLNIAFAAATAIATGVQIAMIKSQKPPAFRDGGIHGFIPSGSRHGSRYGESGLAIIDRQTGREQGEMEGGEAIISREQTQANLPLIQRMFANARTPGQRSRPVSVENRQPLGFRDGGVLSPSNFNQPMYLFGGVVGRSPKRFEDGGYSDSSYDDGGSYSSDGGQSFNEAEAKAAAERAEAQGKEQLKLLGLIADGVVKLGTDQATALQSLENGLKQTIAGNALADRLARSAATTSITTAMGQLRTDLVLAILQSISRQSTESDQLARQIQTGLTSLETGLKSALSTHGLSLQQALALSRLANTAGLTSLAQVMVKAITELEQSNSQQLALSRLASTASFTRLEQAQAKELASLRQVNEKGFLSLVNQSKTDFDELIKELQENGKNTVLAIRLASLTSQLQLTSLEKATAKSLDTLSVDVTTMLELLSDDVTDSLDRLSLKVTTALDTLGEDVTGGLDILNKDTKKSLTALGGQTEAALKLSADRTTRSVDSLSLEVRSLRGSINAVEGAVYQARNAAHGVEGAIWATNQAGRLEALISAISTLG